MRLQPIFCLAILFVLSSCKANSETQLAIDAIQQVLRQVEKCPAKSETPTGLCSYESISFKPRMPMPGSIRQRILVIDDGMLLPAYTRYKSRVIDFIEPDETGIYNTTSDTLSIPKAMKTILSDILDEQFPRVSAYELTPVSDEFYMKFRDANAPGHGDMIFGALADYNPDAEFVIAKLFNVPDSVFCFPDDDEHAFYAYISHLDNLSDSLIRYIEQYQISFINLSAGESLRNMKLGQQRCRLEKYPSDELLKKMLKATQEHLYQKIATKKVVLVQSAASSTYELGPNDQNYLVDCTLISNRIRVGYFGIKESGLPIEGGMLANYGHFLPPSQWNAKKCIDIFVNSGWDNKRPYQVGPSPFLFTIDGIGAETVVRPFSTSWAAPLALSYLLYLKINSAGNLDNPEELIRAATQNGKFQMQDPALHRQFRRPPK